MKTLHNFPVFFLWFLLVLVLVQAGPLCAAEYRLAVRQINPDGSVYGAVCGDETDVCGLVMPLLSENGARSKEPENLEIGMILHGESAYLKFKWHEDYVFHSGESSYGSKNLLHVFTDSSEMKENGIVRRDVKLYLPHPLSKTDPTTSLVLRPSIETIAELDISIKRVSRE